MLWWKLRVESGWVIWLPCPSLFHWAAYLDGKGSKGRVDVPQPHIWLGQQNRGSCRRREIRNLEGFGTILPELRKEHKACVRKLWHISRRRCLEDHSSFLWIYLQNLKIGFQFSAMCLFYFYFSALCLETSFYCVLSPRPQVCFLSVFKC